MSKQFWAVIFIIFAVFVGIFMIGNQKTEAPTGKSSNLTKHIKGEGNVTLVEYGDFQCQFCFNYEPTVKAALAEFQGKVKFQFRNYPLTNAHPNAFAAARAAEAADMQGKFWEMHDALYSPANWQAWTTASDPVPLFNQYAKRLELDADQFKKDFLSSKVNDRVNADLAEGVRLKVSGTPAFFIDGKKVEIANDIKAFQKVLKAAVEKNPPADGGTTTQTPAETSQPPQNTVE